MLYEFSHKRVGVGLQACMRNKILRSANAKYHYSYLFFYKINKGDLPLMDSCVFWCEFIDLVGFLAVIFWPLLLSSYYEVKAVQKNSRPSGPCLLEGGLRPENPLNCRFSSIRGKLLSSLHRSKRLRARCHHACCWKWTFPQAMSQVAQAYYESPEQHFPT